MSADCLYVCLLPVRRSKFQTFRQQQRISIEFQDLKLTLKNGKTILNGITGCHIATHQSSNAPCDMIAHPIAAWFQRAD